MAPEHFVGRGHNHTADYWSLGIVLYEMVTKTVPFQDVRKPEQVKQIVFPNEKIYPSSSEFRDLVK